MYLDRFRVQNFRSFTDTGWLQLGAGATAIVGQNNSGKTALLQAIGHKLTPRPHLDADTRRDQPGNPISRVGFEFVVSGEEVKDEILRSGAQVNLPVSRAWKGNPDALIDRFLGMEKISFAVEFASGQKRIRLGEYAAPIT
jgi:hypothetical protein